MKEVREIKLPSHLKNGVGLNRDRCDVIVETLHFEDGSQTKFLKCSPRNKRTIRGCRAHYTKDGFNITGCPLRNNTMQSIYLLEENMGITLIEKA